MAPVNLKPSPKGITLLVVLAVGIFFACVLAYLGAAGKLNSVSADVKAKEQKVEASKKIAGSLEDSRLKFLDTRAQMRYLESSVSTQAYVPTLLKQLENLGKSVDLQVVAVRPKVESNTKTVRRLSSGAQASEGKVESASESKPVADGKKGKEDAVEEKPYDELAIQIQLKGRYMNALDFLYKLTSFPKIIAVNSLNLNVSDRTDSALAVSPNLDVTIEATAFIFKDQDSGSLMEVPETASGTPRAVTPKGSTAQEQSPRERSAENDAG